MSWLKSGRVSSLYRATVDDVHALGRMKRPGLDFVRGSKPNLCSPRLHRMHVGTPEIVNLPHVTRAASAQISRQSTNTA